MDGRIRVLWMVENRGRKYSQVIGVRGRWIFARYGCKKCGGPIILNVVPPDADQHGERTMHSDYLNPAIRQLRDQQVRFAPREKKIEQAAQAERLLGELDPGADLPLRVHLLPNHQLPARILSRSEAFRSRGQPRPAAVRRGRVRFGRRAGRGGGRAGADGRGAGQAVQRLDQDHFPLAAARAGQPAVRDRTAASGSASCKVPSIGSSSRTRSGCIAARSSAN